MTTRAHNQGPHDLRPIRFTLDTMPNAEGSCLVEFGHTKVICAVSVEEKVPRFLEGTGKGWITSEYAMLPMATETRNDRRRSKGPKGRTHEIQRLIGRALRQSIDLDTLGPLTLQIDCDVLRADGGTRTASITGAWVALAKAMDTLVQRGVLSQTPSLQQIAAISVGMKTGEVLVDLDYQEDSTADVDLNVVMTDDGNFVEVQGTAEGQAYSRKDLTAMLDAAEGATKILFAKQLEALESK